MEQIRSFIAIELPGEVKRALTRLEEKLKSGGQAPVKWVDPYSIHLTLKFLGNIASERVSEITGAMEEAVQGISSFNLEVKDLGVFPNLRRVQVVWVGVGGDIDSLNKLERRIETSLSPLGFAPESRQFKPHLTLARVRDHASPVEREGLGQLVASTEFQELSGFNVDSVNLIRSQLTREGAIYSQIGSVRLPG